MPRVCQFSSSGTLAILAQQGRGHFGSSFLAQLPCIASAMGWWSQHQVNDAQGDNRWDSNWWYCKCGGWNRGEKKKCNRCGIKKTWGWEVPPQGPEAIDNAPEAWWLEDGASQSLAPPAPALVAASSDSSSLIENPPAIIKNLRVH